MSENTTTRDKLALERTRLANERTLLAYVRTGLSLLAAAAVLSQFFTTMAQYEPISWFLAVSGLVVLVIGVIRFFTVRKHLNN